MRLSYIAEKPPSLAEAAGTGDAPVQVATAPSSASKPPPPALSDDMWGELQMEVKRQSIQPELPEEPAADESFVSAADDAEDGSLAADDLCDNGNVVEGPAGDDGKGVEGAAEASGIDMFATAMDGMAATQAFPGVNDCVDAEATADADVSSVASESNYPPLVD